ncbi:Leucine-rich repeat-containing protein 23, related [Eimeria brunetti]|uniref:Leucine-rich repeat-containing protein 23, related n=1 Tax=Eimeria brunetti TaxID=51314 RepID=U6LBL0_9EIME|nr:Leucine-rich repeat-containing protein 23, related [Eimeria brunetti]
MGYISDCISLSGTIRHFVSPISRQRSGCCNRDMAAEVDGAWPFQRALEEDPAEEEGSAAWLAEGLSGLQQTPPDGRLGHVSLSLAGKGLAQLVLLCDFTKLLVLDVSCNKLSSLYPIRLAANLVRLNAQNNQVQSPAELSANPKLEHVDLSNNHITALGDWQFNVRLRVLRLAGNRLSSLKDGSLEKNSLLRELDISNNAVDSLEHLPHLKCLDTLNVSDNQLKNLEGIQRAPHLVVLHAERNKLESLEPLGLGSNGLLSELYIQQNVGLNHPLQLSALKATEALQSLHASPGPIVSFPHWRLHCVHMLPQLLQIDGVSVTAEEQFTAAEAFGDLIYAQRRVWETLIPDEPFVDRRLLKLQEPTAATAADSPDSVVSPDT